MADFELAPDFALETKSTYSTIVSSFENGIEQRRPRRSQPIREFTLRYKNRAEADMQEVFDLYDDKLGAFGSFTWLNPEDGNTYTVRFKEDSITRTYHAYGLWDFSFTLIEVL